MVQFTNGTRQGNHTEVGWNIGVTFFVWIRTILLPVQEEGGIPVTRSLLKSVAIKWCVHGSFLIIPNIMPSGPGADLELFLDTIFLMSDGLIGFRLKPLTVSSLDLGGIKFIRSNLSGEIDL